MKIFLFLIPLFLFLGVPVGAFAKLQAPASLSAPSVGERSASVQWSWSSGGGSITDFELDVNIKRDAQSRPVSSCADIASWGTSALPGASQRSFTLRGLESGQNYCWKIMARAEDPKDNSDFAYSEFTTQQGQSVSVCGNNTCEPPDENANSCPADCLLGGSTSQKLKSPIRCEDLVCFFNAVFSFLFGLAIFIVPVIVIYAAFLMLMGGGDPEKLARGRMILLWTAIAFIIILLSRGLPVVFKNLL